MIANDKMINNIKDNQIIVLLIIKIYILLFIQKNKIKYIINN